jgi:hypothetical protein
VLSFRSVSFQIRIDEEKEFQPLFQAFLTELYRRFELLLISLTSSGTASGRKTTSFTVKAINGSVVTAKVATKQLKLTKTAKKKATAKRRKTNKKVGDDASDDDDDEEAYTEDGKKRRRVGSKAFDIAYTTVNKEIRLSGKSDVGIFSSHSKNMKNAGSAFKNSDSFVELKSPLSELYQMDAPKYKDQAVGQHLVLHKDKMSLSPPQPGGMLKSVLTDGFLFYFLLSFSPPSSSPTDCASSSAAPTLTTPKLQFRVTHSVHDSDRVLSILLLLLLPNEFSGLKTFYDELLTEEGNYSDDDGMNFETLAGEAMESQKVLRRLSSVKKSLFYPSNLEEEETSGKLGSDSKRNHSGAKKKRDQTEQNKENTNHLPIIDLKAFEKIEARLEVVEENKMLLDAVKPPKKAFSSKSLKNNNTLNSTELINFLLH